MKKYIVAAFAAFTLAASAQNTEVVYTNANGVMTAPNMQSQAEDNKLRNSQVVRDITYEVIENGFVDGAGNFIPAEGDSRYTVTATGQNLTGHKIVLGLKGYWTSEGFWNPMATLGWMLDNKFGAVEAYVGATTYTQASTSAFAGRKEFALVFGFDADKYVNLTPKGTASKPRQNWRWILTFGLTAQGLRSQFYDPLDIQGGEGTTINGERADDGSLVYKSTGYLGMYGVSLGLQYRVSNVFTLWFKGKYYPFLHNYHHEGGVSNMGTQLELNGVFNLSRPHKVAPTTKERAYAIEQYEAQERYTPAYFQPAK